MVECLSSVQKAQGLISSSLEGQKEVGEMAQWVKCLPGKCEGCSSDSWQPCECQVSTVGYHGVDRFLSHISIIK